MIPPSLPPQVDFNFGSGSSGRPCSGTGAAAGQAVEALGAQLAHWLPFPSMHLTKHQLQVNRGAAAAWLHGAAACCILVASRQQGSAMPALAPRSQRYVLEERPRGSAPRRRQLLI